MAGGKAEAPQSAQALTPRQQRFVEEYLIDLNATQAAIRAGYKAKNADVQGSALLGKPEISRAVASAKAARSTATGITAERVLRELELLAFSDHRNYLERDGRLVLRKGVPKEAHRAISAVKKRTIVGEDGSTRTEFEVKLWDKPGMLRLAGKHVGIKGFADTLELDAKNLQAPVIQVFTGCAPPAELADEEQPADATPTKKP